MNVIIAFNGPPLCGKSTAREILFSQHQSTYQKFFGDGIDISMMSCAFSDVLYEAVRCLYGVDQERFNMILKTQKDEVVPEFFGLSLRQAVINISENYIKPLHGDDAFARILARKLSIKHNHIFCIDTGFPREFFPFIKSMDENTITILIRLSRDGKDFSSDSRRYITDTDVNIHNSTAKVPVTVLDIENNYQTLEEFEHKLLEEISNITITYR